MLMIPLFPVAPSNYLRNGQGKFSVTAAKDCMSSHATRFERYLTGLFLDTADGKDKNEISFTKGEVLVLLDQQGKWWQVKKVDGSVGCASSLIFAPHREMY